MTRRYSFKNLTLEVSDLDQQMNEVPRVHHASRATSVGGMPLLGYDIDPQSSKLRINAAEATRVRAGAGAYVIVRDATCRLFGYHGLVGRDGTFSLDHMFGF